MPNNKQVPTTAINNATSFNKGNRGYQHVQNSSSISISNTSTFNVKSVDLNKLKHDLHI